MKHLFLLIAACIATVAQAQDVIVKRDGSTIQENVHPATEKEQSMVFCRKPKDTQRGEKRVAQDCDSLRT